MYSDNYTLDPAQGTTSHQIFRVSSLYDFDYSGAGHQPLYYDNLASIYSAYRVHSVYMTVTILDNLTNTTAVANTKGRLVILRDKDAADTAVMSTYVEERCPNIKWRYFTTNNSGRMTKLKFKCVPHIMCGLSKYDDQLAGNVTGNPAQNAFMTVGVAGIDDATDPPGVLINVRFKIYCEFFNRIIGQTQN